MSVSKIGTECYCVMSVTGKIGTECYCVMSVTRKIGTECYCVISVTCKICTELVVCQNRHGLLLCYISYYHTQISSPCCSSIGRMVKILTITLQ